MQPDQIKVPQILELSSIEWKIWVFALKIKCIKNKRGNLKYGKEKESIKIDYLQFKMSKY